MTNKLREHIFIFVIIFILICLTVPNLSTTIATTTDTLDMSWAWLLGYAFSHHFQWGKSIIFTYGPLGFLDQTIYYNNHILWFLSAIINIFVRIGFGVFYILLTYLMIRNKTQNNNYYFLSLPIAVSVISTTSILSVSMLLSLAAILVLIYCFETINSLNSLKLIILSVIAGILLSFGSLIKTNILPLSLFILMIYPLLIEYTTQSKKRLIMSFSGMLSFIVVFLITYILIGQHINSLLSFLKGTYEIIKGYTPSMFLHGNIIQTIVAIGILLYFISIIIKVHFNHQKPLFSQLVIIFITLFFAYKEGFIRHGGGLIEGHALFFFAISLVLIVITILIFLESKLSIKYLNIIFLIVFVFRVVELPIMLNNREPHNLKVFLKLAIKKNYRKKLQSFANTSIRQQYSLNPSIVHSIKNSTVTIIPQDLMMAQGYHMKFIPQIIPQSYSAYTPYLDKKNANQLSGKNAPEKIIYTFQDIDNRYPLFSEPYTFKSMLYCYKTEIPGNKYTLLVRKNNCKKPDLKYISNLNVVLNHWVNIPQNADFMNVYIKSKLFSPIIDILYKPFSELQISFKLADGSIVGPYRFIYGVAKDNLFIKYYIRNQYDINQLFKGREIGGNNLLKKIRAFKLVTSGINLNYKNHYKVYFYNSSFHNE